MPRRLPLFPLNVVLFPTTPMPLHIFEERYRTMLADCLEGDERFGMVYSATSEPPPAGSIGCTAHIHATQLLPDGRSNIVVLGESRFEVRGYVEEPVPYTVALVEDVADDDGPDPEARQIDELRRLGTSYLDALHQLNDSTPPQVEFTDDARELAFQLCAALELDPEVKQKLLMLRSMEERVRQLLRIFPPVVKDMADRVKVHGRARSNGKSHRPFIQDS